MSERSLHDVLREALTIASPETIRAALAEIEWEDAPTVCPGCHAVGEEDCAPGCIDEEIRRQSEFDDYDSCESESDCDEESER